MASDHPSKNASKKIWIVCPCFFDTPSFLKLREAALKAVEEHLPGSSITFVLADDSAGTDPEVKRLLGEPSLEVVTLPYNMGHQGALVYVLRHLGHQVEKTDYIVTLDSDGEDRPTDIPAMLGAVTEKEDRLSLVALAWRTERREALGFKIGYFFFKLIFRVLTGKIIKNGNFAAYRGWFLKEIIYHPHFDQCYASSFISLPLQIQFVPLPRGVRFFGKSKMGYFGLITHGLKMLMPFTERIATRGVIASAFFAVGSAGALVFFLQMSPLLAILAFFCVFSFSLVAGLFILLFATFSQSKAISLRRQSES
jgi:hypothetical protein